MRGRTWWNRLLMGVTIAVATAVCTAGPANAATTNCFKESYSDGAKIVPGKGGGETTRAITRQRAGNTWDDWVFRGTSYKCPADGKECEYTWGKTKTTTSGWAVGGGTDLGNASSPSKKWYNFVIPLVIGYEQSTEITTEFTWGVTFSPGQEATPVQIAVRRWTQGDFSGGWVRTNRGCQGGTTYQWDGNIRFGSWDRNMFEKERVGYAIDGRV